MKTDKQWGEEVGQAFKGLSPTVRDAISIRAACVVREVRSEMNAEAAEVIKAFMKLTDDAARYRERVDAQQRGDE